MLKDTSDDFVRDSLFAAKPVSTRKRGLLKALSGALAIGFVATVLYQLQADHLEASDAEPLVLAGAVSYDEAVSQSVLSGPSYTLATRRWPGSNVLLDPGAGWLACKGGNTTTDQYKWYFTPVPGEEGYFWITNGKAPKASVFMTKESWVRADPGDKGTTGQWVLDLIGKTDEGRDIVTIRPREWPDWYIYV